MNISSFVKGALALIGKIASGVQTAIAAAESIDPALANVPAVAFAERVTTLANNDVADYAQELAAYKAGQPAIIGTMSVESVDGTVLLIPNNSELGHQLGLS